MFSITLLPYSDLNGVCNNTKWAEKTPLAGFYSMQEARNRKEQRCLCLCHESIHGE
jgi:hypothetical protein